FFFFCLVFVGVGGFVCGGVGCCFCCGGVWVVLWLFWWVFCWCLLCFCWWLWCFWGFGFWWGVLVFVRFLWGVFVGLVVLGVGVVVLVWGLCFGFGGGVVGLGWWVLWCVLGVVVFCCFVFCGWLWCCGLGLWVCGWFVWCGLGCGVVGGVFVVVFWCFLLGFLV
ncbi:hypothetical protein RA276_27485, partial [Pseudomonas syringae pv. tagetis]|uniref:hypothetical protein n=1 Tax=Pseudomonas syringae group genomosp. 7 TaxID=251699 RepID=UPI00377055C0